MAGISAEIFFTIPRPISRDFILAILNLFISEAIECRTLIKPEPIMVSVIIII